MNTIRRFVPFLVAALTATVSLNAAPPNGIWKLNNNGFVLTLTLKIDALGYASGFANSDPITGFWDETTGRLMFHRDTGGATITPDKVQIFTGYQFPCNTTPEGGTGNQCLAGSFEAFKGTGAVPAKNVFGWVAYKMLP